MCTHPFSTCGGLIPHRDPVLCSIRAKGGIYLYRGLIYREKLDFTVPESFMRSFVCSQPRNSDKGVTYNTSYANLSNEYNRNGVHCHKVLHQGRFDAQMRSDMDQVPHDDIARACDYGKGAQHDSYLIGLVLSMTIALSGYDHENPKGVFAPHIYVKADHLVPLLHPDFHAQYLKVKNAMEACTTRTEKISKCLLTGFATAEALHLTFVTWIQCAAARPLCYDTYGRCLGTDHKSLPLYRMFPTDELFRLPFFTTPEFQQFQQLVHAAEDRFTQGSGGSLQDVLQKGATGNHIPHSTRPYCHFPLIRVVPTVISPSFKGNDIWSPITTKLCDKFGPAFREQFTANQNLAARMDTVDHNLRVRMDTIQAQNQNLESLMHAFVQNQQQRPSTTHVLPTSPTTPPTSTSTPAPGPTPPPTTTQAPPHSSTPTNPNATTTAKPRKRKRGESTETIWNDGSPRLLSINQYRNVHAVWEYYYKGVNGWPPFRFYIVQLVLTILPHYYPHSH